MLHDVRMGESPRLGRRVVIYGGGNTAMDAARTARRLGADEALIIYRRDRAHMPAHAFEADEALSEGVKIKWPTRIKEVVGPDLTVEMMELDAGGRPHPTGRLETLRADAIVLALDQQTDTAFLRRVPGIEFKADGTVIVGLQRLRGAGRDGRQPPADAAGVPGGGGLPRNFIDPCLKPLHPARH